MQSQYALDHVSPLLRPSLRALVVALVLGSLAACASTPKAAATADGSNATVTTVETPKVTGTVQSIREVKQPGKLGALIGTIGGAAVGGFAGANVGSGSGQIAASSVLSVITGNIGSTLGRMFGGTRIHYEIVVRHEDGIDRTYMADSVAGLKPGVVVAVDAKGQLSPVSAP